ncbi:hypothetical protein ONZ45_g14390 [Pleurotus djamor]|nr:hypothetical protein ONZ45_g14390 [Pleurotus djamor]
MSSHSSSQTSSDDSAKLQRLLNIVGPSLIAKYRDVTISATLLEISEPEDYAFENAHEWVSFASLKKWYTMYLQDSKLASLISGARPAASSTTIPNSISSPRLPSAGPSTRQDTPSTPLKRLSVPHPFFSTPTLPTPRQIKQEPTNDNSDSDDDDEITFVESPPTPVKPRRNNRDCVDDAPRHHQTLPVKRAYAEVIEISDSEDDERPKPPPMKKTKKNAAENATSPIQITRKLEVHKIIEVNDFKSCWPVPRGERVAYRQITHLKTKEEVDELMEWCLKGENKKIHDWAADKKPIPWFIPSINPHHSKISHEDWHLSPADTNLNEGSHTSTNLRTGTSLSLLEAVAAARAYDFSVAEKIA